MKKYFDKDGLIGNYVISGTKDWDNKSIVSKEHPWVDGGDTLQRMGFYHIGLFSLLQQHKYEEAAKYKNPTREDYDAALSLLECPEWKGNYRRHPDPTIWYSANNVMSRDQALATVIAMGARGLTSRLFGFFKAHLKRGLLFVTNTKNNGATKLNHGIEKYPKDPNNSDRYDYDSKRQDVTGPAVWSTYIRGFRFWLLYPMLVLLDFEFFINSLLFRTFRKNDKDVLNHVAQIEYNHYVMPTPLSWFSNRFINKRAHFNSKLDLYFNTDRDPKFLAELHKTVLEDIL